MCLPCKTFAQKDVKIIRSDFKRREEGFREAWKNLKEADSYFEKGQEYYALALSKYMRAYKYNQANAALNYKIGVCFLHATPRRESIHFLRKAYAMDTLISTDIHFQIGRAYHLNYDFDLAINEYNLFLYSLLPDLQIELKPKIEKYIKECKSGKKLKKEPVRAYVENLGIEINSPNTDYIPLIPADESYMIFTSRRQVKKRDKKSDNFTYSEDIYISRKINNKWQKAQISPKPLNSAKNDAAIGISSDGQSIYIYQEDKKGDIYISHLKGDKWSQPKQLVRKINTKFHESSIAFTFDMQWVYFVSDRRDYSIGRKDIYYAKRHRKGKRWGKINNIGKPVNTIYDEGSVFVHPDGKTIYFSSKGHNSMGGYDIFKSEYTESKGWSQPINLGYPINTPADETFFSLSPNGRYAYYSSSRNGGLGQKDIYKITFIGPEKQVISSTEDNLLLSIAKPTSESIINPSIKFESRHLTLVKGRITDYETFLPLEATITIINNENGNIVHTMKSNSKSGKFVVPLPFGINYGVIITKDNYLFHSENINIPDVDSILYKELSFDLKLQPLQRGAKTILKNTFFIKGSTYPAKESFHELNILSKLMKEYTGLRIIVLGHTDKTGSLKQNAQISEARAKAILNYLERKGISTKRIESHGCAYLKPIADNNTKTGRQLNRRVEVQVLEVN